MKCEMSKRLFVKVNLQCALCLLFLSLASSCTFFINNCVSRLFCQSNFIWDDKNKNNSQKGKKAKDKSEK